MSSRNTRIPLLEQVIVAQPAASTRHYLAKAELAALTGKPDVASVSLREILSGSWSEIESNPRHFASALAVAIATFDTDTAAAMINRKYKSDDWIGVDVEENSHPYPDIIRWEVRDKDHSKIWFDSKLCQSWAVELVTQRVVSIMPLLISYRDYEGISVGSLFVNLGDGCSVPGLAFCGNRPNFFLIPDMAFVSERGYEGMRSEGRTDTIPWSQRRPVSFWRGGTSGRPTDLSLGWRSLPRVRLCEIGREHPDILDAGITHVAQMSAESDRELRDSGIMRPFVRAAEFTKFKYQIDIDGNSNSWSGLFQKLLSGNPVLKVTSPYGYRQWYYDRLRSGQFCSRVQRHVGSNG
jgi:Glycosyl transferase family 90